MRKPTSVYDFTPQKLPKELLEAIGLMTASAAQTESIVESAIQGCLGIDFEYGMCVTTHMTMPQKFSALRSAAEIRIDDLDELDELDKIVAELETSFELRNAVVHHTWCRDEKTNDLFTVKNTARKTARMDLIPRSVNQVKRDVKIMYEVGLKLMAFLGRNSLYPAVPDAPRPRDHKSAAARKKRREDLLRAKKLQGG